MYLVLFQGVELRGQRSSGQKMKGEQYLGSFLHPIQRKSQRKITVKICNDGLRGEER